MKISFFLFFLCVCVCVSVCVCVMMASGVSEPGGKSLNAGACVWPGLGVVISPVLIAGLHKSPNWATILLGPTPSS